jgi:hypothetical protein
MLQCFVFFMHVFHFSLSYGYRFRAGCLAIEGFLRAWENRTCSVSYMVRFCFERKSTWHVVEVFYCMQYLRIRGRESFVIRGTCIVFVLVESEKGTFEYASVLCVRRACRAWRPGCAQESGRGHEDGEQVIWGVNRRQRDFKWLVNLAYWRQCSKANGMLLGTCEFLGHEMYDIDGEEFLTSFLHPHGGSGNAHKSPRPTVLHHALYVS